MTYSELDTVIDNRKSENQKLIEKLFLDGITNKTSKLEKGIIEAARVLKPTCRLINSVMYMKEDSTGYKELKKIFEEHDMASMAQYILRNRLFEIHQKSFKKVSDEIIYEGIGEASEGDLLPYAGEWFADAVIMAEKSL